LQINLGPHVGNAISFRSARFVGNFAANLARMGQASLMLAWPPIAEADDNKKSLREDRAESMLTGHEIYKSDWQVTSVLPGFDPNATRLQSDQSDGDFQSSDGESTSYFRISSSQVTATSRLTDKFVTHTAMEDKVIKV